ncbi:hypothetical protein EMIT0347P_80087 [Pseudomonas sp. IT-347P]
MMQPVKLMIHNFLLINAPLSWAASEKNKILNTFN